MQYYEYLLGEDILLFTEWCENHCAWRRKAYLVVVNEIVLTPPSVEKLISGISISICGLTGFSLFPKISSILSQLQASDISKKSEVINCKFFILY